MKYFNSVVFDVDSTLVTIEGLDFLAKLKGKGEELSQLTEKSMGGLISVKEAMSIKMSILSPSYDDLVGMGHAYIENVTKGAKETVSALKKHGVRVWIVTGNFQPAVGMLAKHLDIDERLVITNRVFFDKNQNYLNFDIENPLSSNMGKVSVVSKYKTKMGKVVFVGDGSTDLETKNMVELFIGFGGVVQRTNVATNSDVYITEPDLKAILPHIMSNY